MPASDEMQELRERKLRLAPSRSSGDVREERVLDPQSDPALAVGGAHFPERHDVGLPLECRERLRCWVDRWAEAQNLGHRAVNSRRLEKPGHLPRRDVGAPRRMEQARSHAVIEPLASAGEVRSEERDAEQPDADDPQRVRTRERVKTREQPVQTRHRCPLLRGAAPDEDLQPEDRFGLHELRCQLLTRRSLLDHLRRPTTTTRTSTAARFLACARHAVLAALCLSQKLAAQPTMSRGGSRQQVDCDLRPLAATVVKASENVSEALQRIGLQRNVRERLAARPREPQLSTRDRDLHLPLSHRLGLQACLHPVVHRER